MATYIPQAPTGAIPCGRGAFSISAPNEETAFLVAKQGAGAQVNAEVEGVALRQISVDPALRARVASLRTPRTLYTVEPITQGAGGLWVVSFQAYVVEGG